jgi:transposase
MEVLFAACAGIDVHQKSVVVCRIYTGPDRKVRIEVRTFSTMTKNLLEMADWLAEVGITHVAMESTGDYWKSVYNILEGNFEIWVVNAHHVKNVPGRKTDVKDAQWLAQLMRHGLLRPSLVPKPPQRELRDLTRMRLTLVRERASLCNRLHKMLESVNIKLGAVASDLLGVSCRKMLHELATDPDADPNAMAELALGSMRGKRDELALALQGRMNDHYRFLLSQLLDHISELDGRIEAFEQRIEETSAPFKAAVALVDLVPGFSRTAAQTVVSEMGADMSPFASEGHLASWLGLCPGNNQSGGKRLSGKTRKGNRYARATLVQVAHVVCRMRETQYYSIYRRIAGRRGKKRALIAVAHALVRTIYYVLKNGVAYEEPGADYLQKRDPERELNALKRRAARLNLDLVPKPQAA